MALEILKGPNIKESSLSPPAHFTQATQPLENPGPPGGQSELRLEKEVYWEAALPNKIEKDEAGTVFQLEGRSNTCEREEEADGAGRF